MANQYKNKIVYGNQTLMDITDTTATENDVLEGEVFYSASGARSVGTLSDATTTTHGLMSVSDKIKLDGIDLLGVKLNTTALTPDANGYVSIPLMTGATSSADGTAGLIPAPASADREKFFRGDGTWQDGGRPMVILSYGSSTWNDFIEAYNNNVIVYCRASSNSNPASGSQTRMAFMAYVNNATSPTNVEFQYYRSLNPNSKTASQISDQVFVYTLTSANKWSVTTRQAGIQSIVAATNSKIGVDYSNSVITLSNTMTADDMPMSSSDVTTTKAAIDTLNGKLTSKSESSGGTDLSMVTTGEKYTWNSKADGNHTHACSIATDTGTNQITLAYGEKYKLTAGGSSYIFTMPTSDNSWRPIGTGANDAAAGNHTHGISISQTGTATVTLAANTAYTLTAGGQSVVFKTPVDNNTTYSSLAAASGGTAVSLVTTGEKYTWNNKLNASNVYNGLDKTASGYALDARQGKVLNDKIVWASVAVSFDSSGVGTFTKTGYTLIYGFYDDNWAVEIYGTNRIRCHYKDNWNQLIKSTSGTIWGAFFKTD